MNNPNSFKIRLWAGFSLALLSAALYALAIGGSAAADSKPAKAAAKTEKKANKLSGADLYAMHCNRCHPERYATERTEAQWKTIMLHMRVRANLPADQAKTILKYLQEDSGK